MIEGISPQVDNGRHCVKAVVGDSIAIGADVWKDGHEMLRAAVFWRRLRKSEIRPGYTSGQRPDLERGQWREQALLESHNDRWLGEVKVDACGGYAFTVAAWTDRFASWRDELKKKYDAGRDIHSELLEGALIIARYRDNAEGKDRAAVDRLLATLGGEQSSAAKVGAVVDSAIEEIMDRVDPRLDLTVAPVEYPIWVDREKARFGAWYEIFPRSQGTDPTRGATLREAEQRLPAIADLGFDVLYLTPIHPIGLAHRKGKNNSETCQPGEPGSPWAIGSEAGGHTAVHPELGTLADFDHFLAAAQQQGLEIAFDLAIQCSPDHPWVKEHPAWFSHRPDGTIKYAENPPKKYQDIYPIDFETPDRDGLYNALLDVFLFWIERGVKIFRVDNPHTKPTTFWEWLIAMIHRDHPDVILLAEAFTRPKRMRLLAKVGFSQSYTYFTWRNSRAELEAYAEELFCTEARNYLRPNFFTNTPDILHAILQEGGRPAFIARLVLAATLSPSYGMYNGFELCERVPLKALSEEYLDSEKYQYKVWDWDRPGNIKEVVKLVNRIRHDHPALHLANNLQLLESSGPDIIAYAKASEDLSDVVICAVSCDPFGAREGTIRVPPELYGGGDFDAYHVHDLLSGSTWTWRGQWNYVKLDPQQWPAHVLRVSQVVK
ncbi:MAG: alpha-1,4-glucan--maltose-1-phosphate maltosyltransferase [Deltaproteobacteria bacterium]|nr:alpha-1,4-glucan--maltose-1-phosphate maltosyltransferase [Deltaproteobacteria bacterium]